MGERGSCWGGGVVGLVGLVGERGTCSSGVWRVGGSMYLVFW